MRLLYRVLVAATMASMGYQVAAAVLARRRRGAAAPRAATPPVSILKPIRGLEPHAKECFTSFCVQEYPRYEVLFGVQEADDPAAVLVQELAARYPNAGVRLITTGADLGPNRKVCNLHGLAAAARYDLLLVSDSDMRVPRDYLRRVVAAFDDPTVGLVTCPYRGAEPRGLPAALEALGIAAGFMPGVFVAERAGLPFGFGSTLCLRRETLERIGGFEGLVAYLADDYQVGKRVADLGLRVHLSSVVVDTILGRRPLAESGARRLRWARTVRCCRPIDHLGSGITHTTALALGTLLAGKIAKGERRKAKGAPAFLPLAALAVRYLAAWQVAVRTLESDAARRWFPLLPVSDLVETALWFCSLFGRTVRWRGQRYRLLEEGKIERMEG